MKPAKSTFLDPSYKKTQAGHRKIDGVWFHSYHVGILTYARISEDGQMTVWSGNTHRDGAATYFARVIGHGDVLNENGNPIRFRSEDAACRAAVKTQKAIIK